MSHVVVVYSGHAFDVNVRANAAAECDLVISEHQWVVIPEQDLSNRTSMVEN